MPQEEHINPAILVWARESAGLNVDDAAVRLALGNTKSQTREQKLLELETGVRRPSRDLLGKIAKTYRRPLLTFYMAAPPKRASRGEDFRSTGAEVSTRNNALLDALLRDIKARQEMVRDILQDLDEATPKNFVASSSLSENAASLASRISNVLHIPTQRTNWGKDYTAFFQKLRTETEALGVFVLLIGDLGSHHSALNEDVFRGFALADSIAPFIVINDHDAKTARAFTLVHELVHLYLGRSGVSGTPESIRVNTEAGQVEQFCNEVAGLVLLPESFAQSKPNSLARGDQQSTAKYIEDVARQWMVSEPLIAFRLRRLGWISDSLYRNLSVYYTDRWISAREKTRIANREKEGGPNYYVLKQSRLGNFLIDVVQRNLRENRLTHTRAARVLGIHPSSVEQLLRQFQKSPASIAHQGAR